MSIVFVRRLAQDGRPSRACAFEDYGQREYGVRDPGGHDWYIATPF